MVAGDGLTPVAGVGEHGKMLAAAVVVQRRGREPLTLEGTRHLHRQRRMGTTGKRAHIQPQPIEPAGETLGMAGLARMGGTGEGQLLLPQAEGRGRPAGDEGQRLQRLDGRARIDRGRHITYRQHQPPGPHHCQRGAMAALHPAAAPQLHRHRRHRGHRLTPHAGRGRSRSRARAPGGRPAPGGSGGPPPAPAAAPCRSCRWRRPRRRRARPRG